MRIVIDSYAWIEIFIGSDKGGKAKELISEADEVYTPSIVLAEIARKYLRENIDIGMIKQRLEAIAEISIIVNIDINIALEAAKSYIELKNAARERKLRDPSLADAIILATAKIFKAKILTSDLHFKELPYTIWIESM